MNGIFEPIHKSYQLSTIMAILVGVFGFSTFYFAEKYLNARSLLSDCQAYTSSQAQEINQCGVSVGDLNDQNRGLAAENQRLVRELEQAQNTISGLQAQIAADQQQIDRLNAEIKTLTAQHESDVLMINQLAKALKSVEQDLAQKQAQVDRLEKKLSLMQVLLSGLTALDTFLRWLGGHLYLSAPLLAALFAIPLIAPIKICSNSIESLRTWTKANGRKDGSFSGVCPLCKPPASEKP